jgi:uncharacterized protein
MIEILFSIGIFALAAVALGLGVLLGRRAIEGSCGGLNRIPGVASDCGGTCRRPCRKRRAATPPAAAK